MVSHLRFHATPQMLPKLAGDSECGDTGPPLRSGPNDRSVVTLRLSVTSVPAGRTLIGGRLVLSRGAPGGYPAGDEPGSVRWPEATAGKGRPRATSRVCRTAGECVTPHALKCPVPVPVQVRYRCAAFFPRCARGAIKAQVRGRCRPGLGAPPPVRSARSPGLVAGVPAGRAGIGGGVTAAAPGRRCVPAVTVR